MKKYLRLCIVLMMAALAGFGIGFVINFGNGGGEKLSSHRLAAVALLPNYAEDENIADTIVDAVPFPVYPPRITAETRMVYDFYSVETEDYNRIEEYPAEALLGMTRAELEHKFADWQVVSFDNARIYLRQNRAIEYRRFIIGIHEGYIAVFYDNDDDLRGIKELTNRPIAALPQEEQERLKEGIRVTGNEELMRALEDFSS